MILEIPILYLFTSSIYFILQVALHGRTLQLNQSVSGFLGEFLSSTEIAQNSSEKFVLPAIQRGTVVLCTDETEHLGSCQKISTPFELIPTGSITSTSNDVSTNSVATVVQATTTPEPPQSLPISSPSSSIASVTASPQTSESGTSPLIASDVTTQIADTPPGSAIQLTTTSIASTTLEPEPESTLTSDSSTDVAAVASGGVNSGRPDGNFGQNGGWRGGDGTVGGNHNGNGFGGRNGGGSGGGFRPGGGGSVSKILHLHTS